MKPVPLARRLQRLGVNLAVMLASLIVFFGLVEGAARLAGYSPYPSQDELFRAGFEERRSMSQPLFQPSAQRVWDLVPGFEGHRSDWGDRNWVTLTINLQGRRDREVPLARPPGTYRIAVLGDSVAFGARVLVQDDFASRLEASLNARPPAGRYQVLNFGTPGYGTWQELSMLQERALAYDPDVIVLVFVLNDLNDNNHAVQMDYPSVARVQGLARFLREHSAFYRFLREQILSAETQALARDPCTGADPNYCWENTTRLLDQVADTARQHGIPLVIVVTPFRTQTTDDPDRALKPRYQDELAAYTQAGAIPTIDLLQAFTDNGGNALYVDDYHPNEAGHAVMAREIEQALARLGLLLP